MRYNHEWPSNHQQCPADHLLTRSDKTDDYKPEKWRKTHSWQESRPHAISPKERESGWKSRHGINHNGGRALGCGGLRCDDYGPCSQVGNREGKCGFIMRLHLNAGYIMLMPALSRYMEKVTLMCAFSGYLFIFLLLLFSLLLFLLLLLYIVLKCGFMWLHLNAGYIMLMPALSRYMEKVTLMCAFSGYLSSSPSSLFLLFSLSFSFCSNATITHYSELM